MTYPAPKFLKDDPWFGPAPFSDKQQEYKLAYAASVADNQLLYDGDVIGPTNEMHELMYLLATKSSKTTLQLNPELNLLGGSENFQSGPGGWTSGAGFSKLVG
jgi:hypothetical protein|tara:strand:- start:434 stop:742 length:309 start_codon:yes stop_codon:yes gene_type:complete